MEIAVANHYAGLRGADSGVAKMFAALADSAAFKLPVTGELSVALVDDEAIARIHETFMDDPSATDVITFPADPDMGFAGEIVVSVDHARDRARADSRPFSDELSLYLVHGWLHLCGFDDRQDDARAAMRDAEARALAYLEQMAARAHFELHV